jgi:hypothetical protein
VRFPNHFLISNPILVSNPTIRLNGEIKN